MAYLILVRHGRSEWNDRGLWAGLTDVPLNNVGRQEARDTAKAIKNLHIDVAYTSPLIRAKETLSIILEGIGLEIPKYEDPALNERNYGIYTGKNKWAIKEELGDKKFKQLRRAWDYPIPQGESLKMVYERVVPFYEKRILPQIKKGKNVLISAHGNSLRALVKHIENIPDEKVSQIEIGTGETWIYNIDSNGKIISKEIRSENPKDV